MRFLRSLIMIENRNRSDDEAIELTPKLVVEKNLFFSIPLYQRLFEWTETEIELLLSNLEDSFKTSRTRPYYIGLLTAFKTEENGRIVYSLVDGQQRFTVMTLMSIVMKEQWTSFHTVNDTRRLFFFARDDDNKYLDLKCAGKTIIENSDYENIKMKNGMECIAKYLTKFSDNEKAEFITYIFENMTFFISTLPVSYTLSDLNKYFEAMNSTGKSLENHEQLKVDLLRKLPKEDGYQEEYTRLWNAVSDLNKELVRIRNSESIADKRARLTKAIDITKDSPIKLFDYEASKSLLNDIYSSGTNTSDRTDFIIGNVSEKNEHPKYETGTTEEKALFSFPVFLLLVLYTVLPNREEINVSEFFKISNLRKTFHDRLPADSVKEFFNKLILYRLYLDCYFIRHEDDEGKNYPYTLKNFVYDDDDVKDNSSMVSIEEKKAKNCLKHFQSMLFVSSTAATFYRWITPAFDYLDSIQDLATVTPQGFLSELKKIDNQIHPMPTDYKELSYSNIDRYWFWRTDYYLWENRELYFQDEKELKVANNYVFERNRSIEHIAPQTPKSDSSDEFHWNESKEDNEIKNCFGNLCMITSGQNSKLQNETYNVKKAYVKEFIDENKYGTISSLKMLKMYEYSKWTRETIKVHRNEMFELLRNSYK